MRIEGRNALTSDQPIKKIEQSQETQIRFSLEGFTGRDNQKEAQTAVTGDEHQRLQADPLDQFAVIRHGLEFSMDLVDNPSSVDGDLHVETSQNDQVRIRLLRQFLTRLIGRNIDLVLPTRIKLKQGVRSCRLDPDQLPDVRLSIVQKKSDGSGVILTIGSDLVNMVYIGHLAKWINLETDIYGIQAAKLTDHAVDLTV